MWAALLALAQAAAAPPVATTPPNIVADRLELGFKLCAKHIVRQSDLSKDRTAVLAPLGVRIVDDVPEDVRANTGPWFADNRIFARIGSDGPNVYISTARDAPVCRVIVADTSDGLRGRVAFVDRLRKVPVWEYDQRRSGTANGMMKDELVLRSGLMIAIMNGPNTIVNDGKGIQSFLTVALLPPTGA